MLSEQWWAGLNASLDALSERETTRVATVHTVPLTQERFTREIVEVFGEVVDTVVPEWATAHGDLNWNNLTAPEFWLLDWEDWGLAPRGLDAAMLWASSWSVPELAERVARERAAELESRSGLLARLWACAQELSCEDAPHGPVVRRLAAELIACLRAS
nr:phosphotransferase [Streptoalloteichus tenebrarius]